MNETTINVDTCVAIMHANGLPIGKDALMKGLQDGLFPFGVAIQLSQWRYFISAAKLDKYLAEWGGRNAD